MEKYISIEEIKYIDGKENTLDFKIFNLEYGEIEWNDYDSALPIYDLYCGSINE